MPRHAPGRARARRPAGRGGWLRGELHDLRSALDDCAGRLADSEEALRAIRHGEVDALVVAACRATSGCSRCPAPTAPYRNFVENMSDGAATVSADGIVLYANQALADLMGTDVPADRRPAGARRSSRRRAGHALAEMLQSAGPSGSVEATLHDRRRRPSCRCASDVVDAAQPQRRERHLHHRHRPHQRTPRGGRAGALRPARPADRPAEPDAAGRPDPARARPAADGQEPDGVAVLRRRRVQERQRRLRAPGRRRHAAHRRASGCQLGRAPGGHGVPDRR